MTKTDLRRFQTYTHNLAMEENVGGLIPIFYLIFKRRMFKARLKAADGRVSVSVSSTGRLRHLWRGPLHGGVASYVSSSSSSSRTAHAWKPSGCLMTDIQI